MSWPSNAARGASQGFSLKGLAHNWEIAYSGGGGGSITLSPQHFIWVVTPTGPHTQADVLGTVVPSVDDLAVSGLATGHLRQAMDMSPGDLILVATPGSVGQAASGLSFTVVLVSGSAAKVSDGFYLYVLHTNYIVVDEVVVGSWVGDPSGLMMFPSAGPNWPDQFNVLAQIMSAPIWTAHSVDQPLGTTGPDGKWGAAREDLWPGRWELQNIIINGMMAGKSLVWADLYLWFVARAQGAMPIPLAEVALALSNNVR